MTKKRTNRTLKDRVVELEKAHRQEKLTEEALQESEKRYRAVVEDMPVMVCRYLIDGTLTFVNSFFCSYYLKYKDDLLGQDFFTLFPAEVVEVFRQHLESLSTESPTVIFEIQIPQSDGTFRWQEWTNRALYDENSQLVEYQSIGHDITGQKRAQYERTRMERQLQHAQKVEAVSTLASGLAHDFNNILATIIGHSELAQLYIPDNSMARQALKKILRSVYQAMDLVNLIQTISPEHVAQHKPVQISTVVEEAINNLRTTLPETIELVQQIDDDPLVVLCDPSHLNQVIMNLCTNAHHAMWEFGGVLTIGLSAENLDAAAAVHYPDLQPGAFVKLTVSDTGHGIDRDTIRRIFDPYFTTKEKDMGTGLGLAIVYGIVRNYGGTIDVSSTQGKGTTFTVFLPSLDNNQTGNSL